MSAFDYGWTDEVPGSTSYLNPAVLALARQCNARTVIDAGCGNGKLADFLQRSGYSVIGIDSDAGGIAIAQRDFPSVEFRVGSFTDDIEPVDLVVSTEVVEHLYAPHEFGDFCFRALRPGGALIVSTPYHGYLKNLALSLVNKWDHHHTANWHGGHIKFWSRRTLTTMLESAGLVVTGFKGVGRLPYLWKSMILVARKRT